MVRTSTVPVDLAPALLRELHADARFLQMQEFVMLIIQIMSHGVSALTGVLAVSRISNQYLLMGVFALLASCTLAVHIACKRRQAFQTDIYSYTFRRIRAIRASVEASSLYAFDDDEKMQSFMTWNFTRWTPNLSLALTAAHLALLAVMAASAWL